MGLYITKTENNHNEDIMKFTPKSKKNQTRYPLFFNEDGSPKKVRVYDNGGKTIDRYSCIFTGNYRTYTNGQFLNIGCCGSPAHPLGIGSVNESEVQIDTPSYSHLGKKISFADLPNGAKKYILSNYKGIWNFEDDRGNLI